MKNKKRKIAIGEIIGDSIAGLIAAGGLTLIIFGILADYLQPYGQNWIVKAEDKFATFMKLDYSFRFWGMLVFVLGLIVFLITVSHYAKVADLESEKRARRLQRLEAEAEINVESPVIEAEVAAETPITPTVTE